MDVATAVDEIDAELRRRGTAARAVREKAYLVTLREAVKSLTAEQCAAVLAAR